MPCTIILRYLARIEILGFCFFLFSLPIALAQPRNLEDKLVQSYYYFLLANLASQTQDERIEALKKSIKANPESPYLKRYLLSVYLQEGRLEEAERWGEKLIKKNPEDREVIVLLSKAYLSKDRAYKAISLLERYLEKNPRDERMLTLLATVYLQKKEWDLAQSSLNKLIKIDPTNYLALLFLAKVHQEKGEIELAKSFYLKALELSNYSQFILHEAIQFLERIRDLNTIERIISKLLAKNPENFDLLRYLLSIYIEQNKWEKSEGLLKKYLDKNKAQPDLLFYLGLTLEYRGREDEALSLYESIPRSTPWYFEGLKRAFMLYRKKDHQKAMDLLQNFSPKEKNHFVFKVQGLEQLDLCEEGINVAKEALKAYPDDEELFFSLAGNLACLGNFTEVLRIMEPLLKKKPDDPYLLNFVGYSLVELEMDLERAEELLQKAYHRKPDDPYIEDSLAWLYYKRGNYEKAKEHLERAILNLKEPEATIFEHLGDVYLKLGLKEKACEMYYKAKENSFKRLEKIRIEEKSRECGKK